MLRTVLYSSSWFEVFFCIFVRIFIQDTLDIWGEAIYCILVMTGHRPTEFPPFSATIRLLHRVTTASLMPLNAAGH